MTTMTVPDPPVWPTTTCPCGATIIWAVSESTSRRMPVNAQPTPGGTLALYPRDAAVMCRNVVVKLRFGRQDLYVSHFATCPKSEQFRRRRARGGERRG